jgi:2,4-dienoyl-CoA reductase-like NADH-dependent reductase (Old Yellow Enzyme family)
MRLFDSVAFRSVVLKNRIAVSPMAQYSCEGGMAGDWHLVHLGAFAVGGAGLVMTEAAAVSPEGRITPNDLGVWDDRHVEPLSRVARFISSQGAVPGIQLAHSGRKGSTRRPWGAGGSEGSKAPVLRPDEGGWVPVAPSGLAFDDGYPVPASLDEAGIGNVVESFKRAASRALAAGFKVVEIHAAHGYLLHEFLSPISNKRGDRYGGSLENRARLLREVVEAVRKVWPDGLPLFLRVSATDWAEEGGWDLEQTVTLARLVKPLGVDLVDCSSGGMLPKAKVTLGPSYQVPFAEAVKRGAGIATGAVGLITEPGQAEEIVASGKADLVFLARELLRDPHWPLRAARELGVEVPWPPQYERARLPAK